MSSYFTSPLGYVFLLVFYLTSGLFFFLMSLASGVADLSGVFYMMFFVMLVLIPILTMRLLADDKRLRTDQLTLTSPVSLTGVVVGKFLAAFTLFMLGVVMMLVYGIVLSFFAELNWVLVWGNLLAITLLGMLFISVGVFVSSLTENQMIAAVGAFFLNLILLLMDVLATIMPFEFLKNAISNLGVLSKYSSTVNGAFDVLNILFFISFTVVMLFLTVRLMEKRRWS